MTHLFKKSFLIDPLTTNNSIYRDSLTLRAEILVVGNYKNCEFYGICFHNWIVYC